MTHFFLLLFSLANEVKLLLPQLQNIALEIYENNQMFRVSLAFVPGLLGISYPLIIQTISRVNDLYKSTHIIDRFRKEKKHLWFLYSLMISVLLTLLTVTFFKVLILIAFASVINLIAAYFFNLNLLLKYQSGSSLFSLYMKRLPLNQPNCVSKNIKKTKREKQKILDYWHPIIDLFLYAIRNKDRTLQNNIRKFFIYEAFSFIKDFDQKAEEQVQFPVEFYNSTFDIIASYIENNDKSYYQYFEVFIGEIYFSEGYEQKQFLHVKSLYAVWMNLVQLLENDRDDKVMKYWKNAHQYCATHLAIPTSRYNNNFKETEESIKIKIAVTENRNKFLQFHTVLGAYCMYKRKFKTVKYFWTFTQSQPAHFVLLPASMTEIFQSYFAFLSANSFDQIFAIQYEFKDVEFDALNDKLDVKFHVRNYYCLLFFKQWISTTYFGVNPIALPQIPNDQSEKLYWKENLDFFKILIKRILQDEEMKSELGLDKITLEYCREKKVPHPIHFLEELKQLLDDKFKEELDRQVISKEKISALDEYTVRSLKNAYVDLSRINGSEVAKEDRDKVSQRMEVIRGTRVKLDKEAFVENPRISYLGFEKVIGNAINEDFYNHVSTKFLNNSSLRYEVPDGELFKSIDQLKLNSKDHVVVAFGYNFEYAKQKKIPLLKSTGEENYRYKTIPIYSFDNGIPSVRSNLFIIRRDDLPMIKHKDWEEIDNLDKEVKAKWISMDIIDEEFKIYRKYNEVNEDPGSEGRNIIEIDVDFLCYCWFKKGVKIVALKESGMFQEGGIKNRAEDIPPFEE